MSRMNEYEYIDCKLLPVYTKDATNFSRSFSCVKTNCINESIVIGTHIKKKKKNDSFQFSNYQLINLYGTYLLTYANYTPRTINQSQVRLFIV